MNENEFLENTYSGSMLAMVVLAKLFGSATEKENQECLSECFNQSENIALNMNILCVTHDERKLNILHEIRNFWSTWQI